MLAPLRNIVIQKGASFSELLSLADTLYVCGDYSTSGSPVSIDLQSGILANYPIGTKLTLVDPPVPSDLPSLGNDRPPCTRKLTVSVAASSGAEALTVSSLPYALEDGQPLIGLAIDFTGWTARGQIRRQADLTVSPTPAPLATFGFTLISAEGKIEYKLTGAATSGIPANCKPSELEQFYNPAVPLAANARKRLWAALTEAAYVYDLELVNSTDPTEVMRVVQGLVFVPWEVTL